MPEGFVNPQHAILPEFPTGEQKPFGGLLSNQSSDGFQTQLSETFNKQRRKDQPLLEAFLDANGRLAFRFVDAGGNAIAQPRVTTPGFVPSSLGITPPTLPGTTPSSTPNGVASPTASENLINDTGGSGQDTADPAPPNTGNLSARQGFMNALGFTNPVTAAIAVGRALANREDLTITGLIDDVRDLLGMSEGEASPPGTGGLGQQSGPRGMGVSPADARSNRRSRSAFDGMSAAGTSGPSSGVGSQAGQSGGQGPSGTGGRGGGGPASGGVGGATGQSGGQGPSGSGGRGGGGPGGGPGGGDPGPDAGPGGPGTGF